MRIAEEGCMVCKMSCFQSDIKRMEGALMSLYACVTVAGKERGKRK